MLLIFLGILTGLQLIYWLSFYYGLRYKRSNLVFEVPPAGRNCTIIIFARNEATNLRQFLPDILQQQCTGVEVTVINDASTDDTSRVLAALQVDFPQLNIITLQPDQPRGKKAHLRQMILRSANANVLLTDADCLPAGRFWAAKMASCLDGTHMVAGGYSPVFRTSGLLNSFIRYENLLTAAQYLGFAGIGLPYMAVGRNMGYKQELHVYNDLYGRHTHLRQGDDDLAVQEALKITGIRYCLDPDTFVYTKAPVNISAYLRQKTRHLSVGTRYPWLILACLAKFNLSWLLFYPVFLICLINQQTWVAIFFLMIRFLGMLICVFYFQKKLKQQISFTGVLVFDICYPFFIIFTGIYAQFNKDVKWK